MDLEKTAIERIRTASQMSLQHYGLPLVVTDSGGKDSAVCRELVRRSGVPFELMHNLTTADAPQTIYYVREQFQKAEQAGITCSINKPYYKGQRITMWSLIPMKMIPPTRTIRYCCEVLKENGGAGRFITTGVRWAESRKRRKNRGIYENFVPNGKKRAIILNNDNDDTRRLFAKNIVAVGLAEKCEVQLSYAIGIANPVSVNVNTFGTGKKDDELLAEFIYNNFDLTPSGIIDIFKLRRPIYEQVASYGHFGRTELNLPWEQLDTKKFLGILEV